jgi:hypothetical protein
MVGVAYVLPASEFISAPPLPQGSRSEMISSCLIINLRQVVGLVKGGVSPNIPSGVGVVAYAPTPLPNPLWNPAAAYWANSMVDLSPNPPAFGTELKGGSTTSVLPLLSCVRVQPDWV